MTGYFAMRLGDVLEGARIAWHPTGSPQVRLLAIVTGQEDEAGMVEVTPLAGGKPCSPQRWAAGDDVTLVERPGRHLTALAQHRALAAAQGLRGRPDPPPGRACGRCGRTVAHYPAGHPYPHHRPSGGRCWPARFRS